MVEILISLLITLIVVSLTISICNSLEDSELDNNGSFFTISSFRYPKSEVRPYDTRYIRVDSPPWFSSLNVAMESDVDITAKSISKISKSLLPVICFRDGSPPLPDVSTNDLKVLGVVIGFIIGMLLDFSQQVKSPVRKSRLLSSKIQKQTSVPSNGSDQELKMMLRLNKRLGMQERKNFVTLILTHLRLRLLNYLN